MYICIIEDVVNSLGVVCKHCWSFTADESNGSAAEAGGIDNFFEGAGVIEVDGNLIDLTY